MWNLQNMCDVYGEACVQMFVTTSPCRKDSPWSRNVLTLPYLSRFISVSASLCLFSFCLSASLSLSLYIYIYICVCVCVCVCVIYIYIYIYTHTPNYLDLSHCPRIYLSQSDLSIYLSIYLSLLICMLSWSNQFLSLSLSIYIYIYRERERESLILCGYPILVFSWATLVSWLAGYGFVAYQHLWVI